MFGEVGKYLAVELDLCFEKFVDKFGVGKTIFPGGGVYLDGPEVAESSFLLFPVGELE